MTEILIDQAAAATRLNVSLRTLERWRYTGDGPQYIKYGRLVRYRPSDLEAWLETRERGGPKSP